MYYKECNFSEFWLHTLASHHTEIWVSGVIIFHKIKGIMAKPKKKDNEKKQTCLFTPSSENLEEMQNPGKIYARNCELNCGEVGNQSLPKIAELNCL